MAWKRKHRVTLAVTFDKPCSVGEAVIAVGDCIWGDFYPTETRDKAPGKFVVRGASRAPKVRS